jgi:hypothetical protein
MASTSLASIGARYHRAFEMAGATGRRGVLLPVFLSRLLRLCVGDHEAPADGQFGDRELPRYV